VELRTTGRTVSLDTVRRTQQSARQRLSRVAARLDIEEWRYTEPPAPSEPGQPAAASQPADNASNSDLELPMQGSRTRYVWDAGHQRLAMRVQPLTAGAATLPAGDLEQEPQFILAQKTPEGDELHAAMTGDQVSLERFPATGERRAYTDWPLKHGLENDTFFSMAEHWGGRLEAVYEDGVDLVKVTWSAMGVDTIEWFRPDQGFRLHRKETRDLQKRLHARIVASDYRNVNGFPYPFSYEVTTWDDWEARRITSVMRCTVHHADFAANVRDDDLMIDVPAGSNICLTAENPALLPVLGNRTRVCDRTEKAIRSDLPTLFGMMGAQSRPAESADAGPGK
jgi:hypothetical protein